MRYKYVMFEVELVDRSVMHVPMIFPEIIIHADVAQRCSNIIMRRPVTVVSAGYIERVQVTGLGGQSDSLGIASQMGDTATIEGYHQRHGIVKHASRT
jgi:hypothetical protein